MFWNRERFGEYLATKMPPSFLGLLLATLLLIGGVEPNPGPGKEACELCGALTVDLTHNSKLHQEALRAKEVALEEQRQELARLEEQLKNNERQAVDQMRALVSKEMVLINREVFNTEREQLMNLKERDLDCLQLGAGHYTAENLRLAVCRGKWDQVGVILRSGNISVEHRFQDRMTPLLLAAERGHLYVVQFLVEDAGACTAVTDNVRGRTALHWAAHSGHCDVVTFLVSKVGMSPAQTSALRETPLHVAAEGGFLDIVRYLVEDSRVNIHARDSQEMTAAHLAAKHGHVHVLQFLWERYQGKPLGSASNGWTALHFACEGGHLDVVVYLVRSGAVKKEEFNCKGYKAVAYVNKNQPTIRAFLA